MKRFFRELRRINWPQTLFGSLRRTVITLVIFIPVLVFAASLGYQYYLQLNPAVVYAHKLKSMTDEVNKSIPLPKDETPVVATVTDTNILPKEEFFSFARNGDKIFMYKKHQLAILYRPSTGQVITEAKLNFQDVTPTPVLTPASAVAGASTSASASGVSGNAVTSVPSSVGTPTPTSTQNAQSSGTSTYHPQGKILVNPQQ